jgi:hypothetical protein
MTLLELLTCVSFTTPVYAAFQTARHAKSNLTGYLAAIVVGLAVGFLSAWLMWRGSRRIAIASASWQASRKDTYLSVFFLASTVLWLLLVTFFSHYATAAILRLI